DPTWIPAASVNVTSGVAARAAGISSAVNTIAATPILTPQRDRIGKRYGPVQAAVQARSGGELGAAPAVERARQPPLRRWHEAPAPSHGELDGVERSLIGTRPAQAEALAHDRGEATD